MSEIVNYNSTPEQLAAALEFAALCLRQKTEHGIKTADSIVRAVGSVTLERGRNWNPQGIAR